MKTALSFPAYHLHHLIQAAHASPTKNSGLVKTPGFFWEIPTHVADRAVCETDKTNLQIIPYCTVVDGNTGAIFTYCRGKGSAEARLAGGLSVGLGGHMDTAVPEIEGEPYRVAFCQHALTELVRELEEEVGLDPTYFTKEVLEQLDVGAYLMHDVGREVDEVHVALVTILIIPDRSLLTKMEQGVIEGAEWNSLEQLLAPATFDRLENWSKAIVLAAEMVAGGVAEVNAAQNG